MMDGWINEWIDDKMIVKCRRKSTPETNSDTILHTHITGTDLSNRILYYRRFFLKLFHSLSKVHVDQSLDGVQLTFIQHEMKSRQRPIDVYIRDCTMYTIILYTHTVPRLACSAKVFVKIPLNQQF